MVSLKADHGIHRVMRTAGLLDEKGRLIPGEDLNIALSLFAHEAIKENYRPGDSEFILSSRNLTNHFYCRGDVSAYGRQEMVLSHGIYDPMTKGLRAATDPSLHPMVDACRLTESLVGPGEL